MSRSNDFGLHSLGRIDSASRGNLPCPDAPSVPTAEVGEPETLKVDGSFCSDAYKTMQIFLGNVF